MEQAADFRLVRKHGSLLSSRRGVLGDAGA
jgi:hypothetical protein